MDSLKKEHEHLLVLLADQDNKLSYYRKRLAQLGEAVTDDEDEGDDGEDDQPPSYTQHSEEQYNNGRAGSV
uniref:Uso1/p115-like vesicle tethering protein C-terminal domain-containing protein n=1 Tax=Ditylenchus dipsaci TaxID=166011 RepID=A0A915DYI9_9BILA